MPTLTTFLQDSSGDLDFSGGLRLTSDLATYVKQALSVNLSFFLGEWFLDTRLGMPYFKYIIGQRLDEGLVSSIFRRACLKTYGVADVISLTLSLDNATRLLSVFGVVRLTSGEPLPVGPFYIEVP